MCVQFTGRTAGREPSYSTETMPRHFCKVKCCEPCSYCPRAFAKERNESRGSRLSSLSKKSYSKICERCFLCHSIVLCPNCNKCKKCCHNFTCRGSTSKLLASLVGAGSQSESSTNFERGLPPPLPDPAQTNKISHSRKLLCQSSQGQVSDGGITSAYRQKCSGTSSKSKVARVFQPTFSSSQTKQQVETYLRPQQTKSLPQGGEIQNADTGNHQVLTPTRRMGHIHRFSGRLFPYSNTGQSRKYLRFHVRGRTYQFKALPFGLSTAPLEFTVVAKEVKLMATHKGIRIHQYLDDWLVRAKSHQVCLQHTQALVQMCRNLGWVVNLEKSELIPKQIFNFVGYQFDLRSGRVRPTPDRWQSLQIKIQSLLLLPACPVRQFMSLIGLLTATEKQVYLGRLHMRPIQWHLKNNWRVPESLEKVIPIPRTLHPHLQWWLEESNVLQGQPLHPIQHALQIFTDASKEGWGAHLDEHTARGCWSTPESNLHINYLELKAVFLALVEFQDLCTDKTVLIATDNTTVVSYINKEGGMRSGPLCALLWRILTWCTRRQVTIKARHIPGRLNVVADKLSRLGQIIQTEWSPPRGFSDHMQQVAPASSRPLRHKIQQVAPVRISSTRLPSYCSRCTQSTMGGSGCICLPTGSHSGQSGREVVGFPMQKNDTDCSRMAQHALVLGPSDHVQSDTVEPSQHIQPANSTFQSDPSQKSDESKSPCMAPRATPIKEQGFSKAVATRIEAPQRGSTRSVYEAKWAIFTKWCVTNQVDFRAPPVKSVADFLLYLFEDRKLQPSTIDGYRSAIADKLGNSTLSVSKDENLTRLLDSFHRDRPKGRRGIPSWNLSLVLHQLTKPPFEPIKEASLKCLTFKTVFLLALGSGKRRSEIHAWQNKNIRHQSDWSKVSLYPSPSFLSKNQLAKEGPDSVAPVVIPALAPTLDRSLMSDRSLFPVRALRYYLDRTSDLRQNKELVFVSFKKGFDRDISPATISSWIKQTVILCYELSDQEAHTLHQVKAHDVRAFAASKAFQSRVSLEQILAACHWKSHNTFTQLAQ